MPARKIKFRDHVFSKRIFGYDPRDPLCGICHGNGLVVFAPSIEEIRTKKREEFRDYGECLCVNPYHIRGRDGLFSVVLGRGWEKKSLFSEVEIALPVLMR